MNPIIKQKILVAIDQSDMSDRAFDSALTLAQALGAELTILNVLDIFDPNRPRESILPMDGFSRTVDVLMQQRYEKQWADYVHRYETLLQQKQAIAQSVGVKAEILHAYGRPETVICNIANTHNIDFLVVGSHGRTGLNEMLLGSVSNYVMHHAPCSVMVVHPNAATDTDAPIEKLTPAAL